MAPSNGAPVSFLRPCLDLMNSVRLNEHDAHQGAQSSGEFLGMSGNSGWYLLGSAGATIMMVIFLWGVLGVSLLLCLLVGIILCILSMAYVLVLKNNRPEHYDTDYFESALVEAGVIAFVFGPRARPASNPFVFGEIALVDAGDFSPRASRAAPRAVALAARPRMSSAVALPREREEQAESKALAKPDPEPMDSVSARDYEQLQEQLAATEELLEDAYADGGRRDL